MSTIETPSATPYRKPSRWRRFFVGSALILAGVIVIAVALRRREALA